MKNKSTISDAMTETLSKSDLGGLSADLVEAILDSQITDVLAKDLPVVKTFISLTETALHVKDLLFLKKLLAFMAEIRDVPSDKRASEIAKIDSNPKYRVKVGEKLLYVIDKADDHMTTQVIAWLFKAFLNGCLKYDYYIRACRAVQNVMLADLWNFVDSDEGNVKEDLASGAFLNSGLLQLTVPEIVVEKVEHCDWKDALRGEEWRASSSDLACVTAVGKKVREVLQPYSPNRKIDRFESE